METNVQEISINGVDYVRKDSVKRECDTDADDIRIVILQRGFVMVGKYRQNGSACELHNAHVIRRWGTTKGLGEIAANGPLTDTTLDHAGVVKFHELTVIATINCEAKKWKL